VINGPASVTQRIGDDVNTSTLNPYPMIPVSSITYTGHPELNGQCTWINSALDAFKAANPKDGSGPSHEGWTYSWAGVATEAKVEQGLSLFSYTYNGNTYNGYNPWVGTQPSVKSADGSTGATGIRDSEVGGAVINLKYTPVDGAPAITNLHWIQAYTGTYKGSAFGPILDNDPDHPYSAQASDSPYYDTHYAAGTLARGGAWFRDRPYVPENEYEGNPVVSSQFQVVLVGDTTTQTPTGPGGAMVTQNTLTLYGGEWWGYQYTALEMSAPEPSTGILMLCGAAGVVLTKLRIRRRQHES
jgi:hypothetical protein